MDPRDRIAVGVPVFERTAALRQFLESVPNYVSTAYIADNGHTEKRQPLYDERWSFELEVLDLDFDVGIGACRKAIADAATEPFLWVGDNDMVLLREDDLRRLRATLQAREDLGGISGWLIEEGTVRSGARNLTRAGDTVVKTVDEPATLERGPVPFARFDFIPQAGLFRTEAYETYAYDPDVYNSEHVDFFLGQQAAGEWEFASTPAVMVEHDRWINTDYRESTRGHDHVDMDVLDEKWGVAEIEVGTNGDWAGYRNRSAAERAFDVFRSVTPPRVWLPVKRAAERGGLA